MDGSSSNLLDELAKHIHKAPFDLGRAPLAHLSLITVGELSELLLTVHHAVLDGWSMQRLVHDLAEVYHTELAQPGSASFSNLQCSSPSMRLGLERLYPKVAGRRR